MVDSMKSSTKGKRKNNIKAFAWLRRRPPSADIITDDGCVNKHKHNEGWTANDTVAAAGGGGGGDRNIKERSRRSFSRVLKAMLFQKSVPKKTGNKKSKDTSLRSGNNSSLETGKNLSEMKENSSFQELRESHESMRSGSNLSGSSILSSSINDWTSLSSSSASSIASSSRSTSERRNSSPIDVKQVNYNKKQASLKQHGVCYFSSTWGLCYLLLVLLVFLTWGKMFAVFCTCICMFFASRRSNVIQSCTNNEIDTVDVDSEEYKKRVIMEGLLERNRNRVL